MTDPHCPDCGAPLPADSPQALCPACLMRQALVSRTIAGDEGNPPSAPPPSPEEIADKFPQFEVLECLGRGGMGVVYKARQKSLNRLVAIKILAPEREREPKFAERFAREAELLAKLNHPHIVTIHDFGQTGGLFFLVMEFVDGVNLRDLLRAGKLEPEQALAIVPPICEALQYAHERGIVHRDIKPENLLLDRDGRIKIADFGIASLVGAGGETAGTPPYMAPEQSDAAAKVDHRADIYALGAVLYEMLTGERPAKDLVVPSRKVQLDVKLDEMVMRALDQDPERRYQTAEEFRSIVETAGAPAAPPPEKKGAFARFWWLFPVMILVGVLLLGFGYVALSYFPKKHEATKSPENVAATIRIVDLPAGAPIPRRAIEGDGRLLAVLRAVIPDRSAGELAVPFVPGRTLVPPDRNVPHEGTLKIEVLRDRGGVVCHPATLPAGAGSDAWRKLGKKTLFPGEPAVLEDLRLKNGRRQLVLLWLEETDDPPGMAAPATGGYGYGPVVEVKLNDPALAAGQAHFDLDAGDYTPRYMPGATDLTGRLEGQAGGVQAVVETRPYPWKSKDAGMTMDLMEAPAGRPAKRILAASQHDLDHGFAWLYCTAAGSRGLLQITGKTGTGVTLRYKRVMEPSLPWDAVPGTAFPPPDVRENAVLAGGRSPDGRYEVHIEGRPNDFPFGYGIQVHETGKDEAVHRIDDVGGWMRYSMAKVQCRVHWHASGECFVFTDRGTKTSNRLIAVAVKGGKFEELAIPDYLANALGRIGVTGTSRGAFSTPREWEGDKLRVDVRLTTGRGPHTCEVVLDLVRGTHMVPRLRLESCSDPVAEDGG